MTDINETNLGTVTVNESCELTDLTCHFNSIADFFFSFFLWAYESIVMSLVSFVDSIPIPSFIDDASGYSMPDALGWFAEPFAIGTGATIIVSAYVLRFIIRRLPFVG